MSETCSGKSELRIKVNSLLTNEIGLSNSELYNCAPFEADVFDALFVEPSSIPWRSSVLASLAAPPPSGLSVWKNANDAFDATLPCVVEFHYGGSGGMLCKEFLKFVDARKANLPRTGYDGASFLHNLCCPTTAGRNINACWQLFQDELSTQHGLIPWNSNASVIPHGNFTKGHNHLAGVFIGPLVGGEKIVFLLRPNLNDGNRRVRNRISDQHKSFNAMIEAARCFGEKIYCVHLRSITDGLYFPPGWWHWVVTTANYPDESHTHCMALSTYMMPQEDNEFAKYITCMAEHYATLPSALQRNSVRELYSSGLVDAPRILNMLTALQQQDGCKDCPLIAALLADHTVLEIESCSTAIFQCEKTIERSKKRRLELMNKPEMKQWSIRERQNEKKELEEATEALIQRLTLDAVNMKNSDDMQCYKFTKCVSCQQTWQLKIPDFVFIEDYPLIVEDLQTFAQYTGKDPEIVLQIKFSLRGEIPSVRVVTPRFYWGTGHVTLEGIICAEVLQSVLNSDTTTQELILIIKNLLSVDGLGRLWLGSGCGEEYADIQF